MYNKITVRQMHREFRLQAVIHSFIHIRLINIRKWKYSIKQACLSATNNFLLTGGSNSALANHLSGIGGHFEARNREGKWKEGTGKEITWEKTPAGVPETTFVVTGLRIHQSVHVNNDADADTGFRWRASVHVVRGDQAPG